MIIPSDVKVGNFVYTVDVTDEVITLDNKLTQQNKERVFLHELVHAICFDKELHFGEDTENVVDALAKGLHGVIIDNPNLFCTRLDLFEEEEIE